jgi:hypothetical protein
MHKWRAMGEALLKSNGYQSFWEAAADVLPLNYSEEADLIRKPKADRLGAGLECELSGVRVRAAAPEQP